MALCVFSFCFIVSFLLIVIAGQRIMQHCFHSFECRVKDARTRGGSHQAAIENPSIFQFITPSEAQRSPFQEWPRCTLSITHLSEVCNSFREIKNCVLACATVPLSTLFLISLRRMYH